jgi:hypothetical protein
MRSRAFGGLAAVAAILLLPAAASAAHNPGTYTGPIEGGGTVAIDITEDAVTRFEVIDLPTYGDPGPCAPVTMTYPGTVPVAHTNILFSTFDGSFPQQTPLQFDGYADRANEISGRLQYLATTVPGDCASSLTDSDSRGNVAWTATTGGGCLNSEQYLTAKATLDRLKAEEPALKKKIQELNKQMLKAEKQGNDQKAKKLSKKRGKLQRELRKVRSQLKDAKLAFEYAC